MTKGFSNLNRFVTTLTMDFEYFIIIDFLNLELSHSILNRHLEVCL